ncbi:hypothetical protein B0H16DRAFT_50527 [Mycena metata]|uniref:Uncharacterized protein n=1 Tax=Mycena metata TaxID=1033252 RepID=A0AAD7IFG7_9AGAR|nr:hypothetical protein B0H16DRAFT_50527 [Mycena metata]
MENTATLRVALTSSWQKALDDMQIQIEAEMHREREERRAARANIRAQLADLNACLPFPVSARAMLDDVVYTLAVNFNITRRQRRGRTTWDIATVEKAVNELKDGDLSAFDSAAVAIITNETAMRVLFRGRGNVAAHTYDDEQFRRYCAATSVQPEIQNGLQTLYSYLSPAAAPLVFLAEF